MTAHEALLLHFVLPALPAPAASRAATLIISPATSKILVGRSKTFTAKISLVWERSRAQLGLCAAARAGCCNPHGSTSSHCFAYILGPHFVAVNHTGLVCSL